MFILFGEVFFNYCMGTLNFLDILKFQKKETTVMKSTSQPFVAMDINQGLEAQLTI